MQQVNYKNKKRYNTGKKPIRQPIYLTWLIWVLSKFALIGKKKKIEKINMDGLKPPLYDFEQPYVLHRLRADGAGYVSAPCEQRRQRGRVYQKGMADGVDWLRLYPKIYHRFEPCKERFHRA